jgi:hypothetical protein
MTEHDHQIEAIAAGAQHLLRRCQERFHLLGALLKAIDEAEAVQAQRELVGTERGELLASQA